MQWYMLVPGRTPSWSKFLWAISPSLPIRNCCLMSVQCTMLFVLCMLKVHLPLLLMSPRLHNSLASHRGRPGSSPSEVTWDLWWTKVHWGKFPPVLRCPLPIIPPTAQYSSSPIIRGRYNRPNCGRRTKWTRYHPTPTNIEATCE
jgi:hypothetical protein